ncbi:MAG: HAD-IA family hydrolase [Pseudomonadota bacterium]
MLFIFDWDGTLSDSKAKITSSMQFAAQDMGWEPLADHLIHNIIGLGLPEAILYLYPAVGTLERAQLRERYAENFLRLDEQKASDFFPLVNETLSTLRAQGHLLTIATGKSRKGLDRILGVLGMGDYFDATRCADETASKPSPLMLEELLQEFDLQASDAVMIGDTSYDMEMARNISMPRIAVSYGAHQVDRLYPYEPELCVDRIDEILSWHRIR